MQTENKEPMVHEMNDSVRVAVNFRTAGRHLSNIRLAFDELPEVGDQCTLPGSDKTWYVKTRTRHLGRSGLDSITVDCQAT